MNPKQQRRLIIILALVMALMSVFSVFSFGADKVDAMDAIEADENLSCHKKGNTVRLDDDGYIGIPIEISVYYSGENDDIVLGTVDNATPVVIYVVNSNIERIGTDSDINIITSMLNRGYIVVIFDYLNNAKSVTPNLDWSVQAVRAKVTDGTYCSGAGLPSGTYNNNMVVPAGYDIEFNQVFWEFDKHSADGTFERIIEVWNNDFRAKKKNVVIKWVDESGKRKATQNGIDGSAPVWLDASGNANDNGEYIKVKHTKAEKIEDCVKSDGTPIDLNLYMHVVYPTNPTTDVPVMVLSSSSGYLSSATQTKDRPQFNGFLFSGYATAVFDHGYVPMARNDHYGYFDGDDSDSITGDNSTYSVHTFNNSRIDTAAMRYIRYLSASDHDKYSFNSDAVGVYGNSKGGWATMLGEKNPDISYARRIYPGFNGKTRYENGKTDDLVFGNYVIDGGEEQPWLTYEENELRSGADMTYMSCGWGAENITSEHSPTFISCNLDDGSFYSMSNKYVNACRNGDVVAMWFEVDQGHTFASAEDMRYGVSTYQALFDFAAYHLKGESVKVSYIYRDDDSYSGMPTNAPITVKFTGSVSIDEISKITLVNSKGEAIGGRWTSQFGNTEWTLETATLKGCESYTLTVPAGIKGDNGNGMSEGYTYEFNTGKEKVTDVNSITTENGTYLYFIKPDASTIEEFKANIYTLRLYVSNEAVNKLQVYTLSGFDVNSPDSAVIRSLVATVSVTGIGQYDVDVTSYVESGRAGATQAFLVKQLNEEGEVLIHSSPLTSDLGGCTRGSKVNTTLTAAPDGTKSWKIHKFNPNTSYVNDSFYQNYATVFTNSAIIKNGNLTEDDIGRTFRISFKIYDTTSRILNVQMVSLSSSANSFADYNVSYYNVYTKANEWVEVSFEHTVYEPLYADKVGYKTQKLTVTASLEGSEMNPMYISEVKSIEIFTDITVQKAELLIGTTEQETNPLVTKYGTIPDKYASVADYPFVVFDSNGTCVGAHANLLDITDAYNNNGAVHIAKTHLSKSNYWDGENYGDNPVSAIVVMRNDYTMNSKEQYYNLAQVQGLLTIDLNGYTLTSATSRTTFPASIKPWTGSGDADGFHDTEFKFINGTIISYNKSVITYSSTASEYKKFDISFENIEFKALGNAENFLVDYSMSTSTKNAAPNVEFKNCTFDISNSTASNIVLFNLGKSVVTNTDTGDTSVINTDINVIGCKVVAEDKNFTVSSRSSGADSKLTFAEGKYGNYLEIELDQATVPSGTFNDGKLTFVKTGVYGETNVYALAPVTINSYLPLMSITLDNDLVMNVYIPVTSTEKFTFNGVKYDNLASIEEKIVTIDSKDYYHFAVALGSTDAAKDLKLVASVKTGETEATATFTFSIPKYAGKLLADDDATEPEQTLASDVLAYIKAAYNYAGFAGHNTASEIARVNALIDSIIGDYVGTPTESGANADNNGGVVTAVTLNLDATPSIRFYTTNTSLALYANGRKLNTVSGTDANGTYVELDVYAYALAETITFGNGGSYHISSFANGAGANEKALANAFVKYVESAKAYREQELAKA